MEFQELLSSAKELERPKRERLIEELENEGRNAKVEQLLSELHENSQITCPDCDSAAKIKHGVRAGRQRFKCKECGRLYTETTNTPFENLQGSLDTFVELIELIGRQVSVRKIADELDISTKTAFEWRKKVMDFYAKLHERQELTGIVEADETYLLHSRKGDKGLDREPRERGGESQYHGLSRDQDCILTLKDRSGNIFIKLVGQARPAFDDIEPSLANKMADDAVLCTDGMKAYGKFAREYGVERKNIKETDERSYHIQGINALHHEIKNWLREFRGIASKYIDTYLGYFAYQRAFATS